jgi:two-component system, OmpR family, KDP operon response regulator KdpE
VEQSLTALVIEDDPYVRRAVRNVLGADLGRVLEAANAREGLDLAAAMRPDLIVLDLGLPDRPGISVCQELREWSSAPIIVLSARHAEQEKVALLDAGADDYVTKPFSPSELRARVRAQLRRARTPLSGQPSIIEANGLTIDAAARIVRRDGEYVHLTPIEWDLLRALVQHAGRTLTHEQIFRAVWRSPAGDAHAYLRVHIANLRRKIERDPVRPSLIVTEPGVGYRFELS